MLRRVVLACAVLLACALFSAAEAGLPIPCANGHSFQAPEMSGSSPPGFVLYYTVSGCSDGSWDAYYSDDGKKLPIPQHVLSSLPKPPSFWASARQHKGEFWKEWFWIFFAPLIVVGTLLAKYAEVFASDVDSPAVNPRTVRRR